MKIFNTFDIKEIDKLTIENEPVSSVDLMERAAMGCAAWIKNHYVKVQPFIIFTGPGNNGGDGWAIARILTNYGFSCISVYHLDISPVLSPDSEVNRDRLIRQGKVAIKKISGTGDFPVLQTNHVIIDALFGSGLSRPLEGLTAELINHLNRSGCPIISIDLPSGLMGEENHPENIVIKAQTTLTFQFPKRSFLYAENYKYTGSWYVIDIGLHGETIRKKETGFYYVSLDDMTGKIPGRDRFSHKGMFGHALLIAGSYGMTGAAILAARSCMRSGAGLLTTHLPGKCYAIAQTAVPESVFSIDKNAEVFSDFDNFSKYSAVGAGPGLGTSEETSSGLLNFVKTCDIPMVLDADALNILSVHPEYLSQLPENAILTPHPGEFDRLFGKSENGMKRNMLQIQKSKELKVIIILKGAFSSITLPDGTCWYNSTGNPGMATGGSGDVLTGVILSLLSQRFTPANAAITGTFIHGLAGDLAAEEKGQRSMIASDIIEYLSLAFKKIQENENPA